MAVGAEPRVAVLCAFPLTSSSLNSEQRKRNRLLFFEDLPRRLSSDVSPTSSSPSIALFFTPFAMANVAAPPAAEKVVAVAPPPAFGDLAKAANDVGNRFAHWERKY